MKSLKDLLIRQHGYEDADFIGGDTVAVDSNRGTINASGKGAKPVFLDQIFRVGHYVTLPIAGAGTARFVVTGVNHDGLDAVSVTGEQGFLPWESMVVPLQQCREVFIEVLNEKGQLDEAGRIFVAEEMVRLSNRISQQEIILAKLNDQRDRLGRKSDDAF